MDLHIIFHFLWLKKIRSDELFPCEVSTMTTYTYFVTFRRYNIAASIASLFTTYPPKNVLQYPFDWDICTIPLGRAKNLKNYKPIVDYCQVANVIFPYNWRWAGRFIYSCEFETATQGYKLF